MKSKLIIALSTVPNAKEAKRISKALVSEKLAACVNIIPGLKSIYTWKGKLENSKELLLIIKTKKENLKKLESRILALHSYNTPEFVVLDSSYVSKAYLKWAHKNC